MLWFQKQSTLIELVDKYKFRSSYADEDRISGGSLELDDVMWKRFAFCSVVFKVAQNSFQHLYLDRSL